MENMKGAKSQLWLRKRKMMVMLPVVLIPLLTIGFYALGGGTGGNGAKGIVLTKGLNMSLPEAKFDTKKKSLNKLGFYKQSEQDSIKVRESRKHDPYFGWKDSSIGPSFGGFSGPVAPTGLRLETSPTDVQAGDLMRKLDLLKGVLNRQQQTALPEAPLMGRVTTQADYPGGDRVRAVLPSSIAGLPGSPMPPFYGSRVGGGSGDGDLDKLNTLMDKVLRVRYPGEAPLHDSSASAAVVQSVQTLTVPRVEEIMTTLPATDKEDLESGFIDLDETSRNDSLAETMIAAVVDGAQTLISGETVGLRTAGDAMLGGVRVPYGTALTGKAMLSGERLLITVSAIRIGRVVIPVSLEVLDMDGMPGVRVKGSLNRDVSKESAAEAVGSLGLTPVDESIAGQATAAGIQATKSLLSRKIRLVRVGLPAGYRVLLRNSKVNH